MLILYCICIIMDCVRRDMQALRITPEDAQDRTIWKSKIWAADLHLVGKGEEDAHFVFDFASKLCLFACINLLTNKSQQ